MKQWIAAAGALGGVLVLAGCFDPQPPPAPPTASTPTPSVVSTPTPTATPVRLIDYSRRGKTLGVDIIQPSDVEKLTGTSQAFKDFLVAGIYDKELSGCTEPNTFYVTRYRSDGWAFGGMFTPNCGGGRAVFRGVDDKWTLLLPLHGLPGCDEVKKYRIPRDIIDRCLTSSGVQPNKQP